jgi:hypothetical protein
MNKIVSVTTSSLPIFANKKLQIYSDRVRLEFEKFWRNSGKEEFKGLNSEREKKKENRK